MAHMGESRTELIGWINDLLQLSYTKVEQCGTGAVYCQVIDSIFLDVPMSKVKMQAKMEYEYLNNFKVLQKTFKDHGIDKPVPVANLVKCKMMENLEFLQWLKKYWDLNYPGGEYDAVGRRKGLGGADPAAVPRATRSPPTSSAPRASSSAGAAPRRPIGAAAARTAVARVPSAAAAAASEAKVDQLTMEMSEMRLGMDGLEKERDFYFNKLRDIEIIIGARLETQEEELSETERANLLQMQGILYSTEDGFEVPEGEEGEVGHGEEEEPLEDEEETFASRA